MRKSLLLGRIFRDQANLNQVTDNDMHVTYWKAGVSFHLHFYWLMRCHKIVRYDYLIAFYINCDAKLHSNEVDRRPKILFFKFRLSTGKR